MSKKNYDSAFCGSLPLHKINLVQPHGVLLVINNEDFSLLQVSENVEKLLQKKAADLVGNHLGAFISPAQLAHVKKNFEGLSSQKLPFTLTLQTGSGKQDHLALIHRKDKCLLVEVELQPLPAADRSSFTDVYLDIKHTMAAMEQAQDINAVCAIAAAGIKKVSGFDKVMIYQFDGDWNGTVIAELMGEGVELDSYMGLTFPASDIPQQVRNLYLRNPYRLIPDRNAQPVGLYPVINPLTQNFVDLTDCDTRAVAAVHLEYMKNMKIEASMSTRIIKDDNLWGLISCHHRTAKQLSFETCAVLELLSTVLSAKIASLLNKAHFGALASLQDVYARLVEQVYRTDDLLEGLTAYPTTVLDILRAPGVAILSERGIQTVGTTPSKNDIRELALWLYSNNYTKLYHQENLSGVYDEGAGYAAVASGILSLPLNPEKREYIIAFRPELVQSIDWGGDPSTAIQFEKDNLTYHPRNSFAVWQQTVKNTSVAWKSYELEVAEQFRHFISAFMIKKSPF
jgi:chemotaxis family two-component system sensor kinase Cph1